ncbi:MAG: endonuclease III [Eubacteriales bacterium]|nr:endonuclease III [Eubacteriales bacterium]
MVSQSISKANRAVKISAILDRIYPDACCSLKHKNGIQLLVAVQLSAQCTDERVNKVTESLFKKYKTAKDFAEADPEVFSEEIRSTGFFRNKTKNIISCCRMICEKYRGELPGNLEDMLKLPGVGRKTANVVLGELFDIPGIVVDTHVIRLSNRLGLTDKADPEKIEFELMELLPKEKWNKFCHQLILHGRSICNARKPKCEICELRKLCVFGSENAINSKT